MDRTALTKYAWLSIGAAVATIGLKSLAYLMTGSVGLLSDAAESIVNLLGAVMALAMLIVAARPPDKDHHYGHSKAEYFASGVEGVLILMAAASIGVAAVHRLLEPQPIEQAAAGLAVSAVASLINLVVARILLKAGKAYNSITLEADAKHLMTDVWTSAGVIAGVVVVALTKWQVLDPLVAIGVAGNIVWTGSHLIRRSIAGLMDTALGAEDEGKLNRVLDGYRAQGIQFHALRSRQSAGRCFISVHVLVPGKWSVHRGHHLVEDIEKDVRLALAGASLITHLEPIEDEISYLDSAIE